MGSDAKYQPRYAGSIVEYLDEGRFRAALALREQERHVAVLDADGRERLVARDLVMIAHPERRPTRDGAAGAIAALEAERAVLARELDLNLLWEIVQEQGRSFNASELADLFFGRRSSVGDAVMLEALLADRLYFTRRHMDFAPRAPDQVERLRMQQERVRARSDDYRRIQTVLREVLSGGARPPTEQAAALSEDLNKYLKNPFTRSRELTQMLTAIAPEVDCAEAAFEILERIGARPAAPRFAMVAGLRADFSDAARAEAAAASPPPRPLAATGFTVTIDDDDTVEVDDALECEALPGGVLRVRVHIALVADFVAKGGAMDQEAAARATTVYLPETTVRMLPDAVACEAASLIAGRERPVLTTDVTISPSGEVLGATIYPARVAISRRLDYPEADQMIAGERAGDPASAAVRMLHEAAARLRERRRTAGAMLMYRREAKVRVRGDEIEIFMLDSNSPSRTLVAELMVLSNFVAARYAAENRIPIIYRVQPDLRGDAAMQRPRLSMYPEFHAGIGLAYYAQLSSPIRRYADLVLQRQLLAALTNPGTQAYSVDELLTVLAGSENAEASFRDLERRAKRYWTLRFLERAGAEIPMRALATRDGAGAELVDYAVRGTLRGAPNLADETPIIVQLSKVDPLRGWLAFDYLRIADSVTEGAS
ncbi:MAG TPA: ribonuclease catalytic domain-containing protein [Candidatus Binataceae bacterium]|nr:ribonuclease catalytic domain-containing protein [Candidatus Binataceae bacterium]